MKSKGLKLLSAFAFLSVVVAGCEVVKPSSSVESSSDVESSSESVSSSESSSSVIEVEVSTVAEVLAEMFPSGLGTSTCTITDGAVTAGDCVIGNEKTIEGIFVGYGDGNYALERGAFYLQDAAGDSMYLYNAADQDAYANLLVGQKVQVTGITDIYSGLPQMKNFTFEVIDETVVDVSTKYTTITIDELLAAEAKDAATRGSKILGQYKIEDLVVYSNPSASAATTFASLEDVLAGVETPDTIDVYRFGQIGAANLTPTIQIGDVVDLFGSLTAYHYDQADMKLQLHATRTAETFKPIVEKTVSAENAKILDASFISLPTTLTPADTSITLPTTGTHGSKLFWTSSHPEVIAVDGTVTTPVGPTDVTLTVAASAADATAPAETDPTATFVISVLAEPGTVADALAAAADAVVYFKGIVVDAYNLNTQYSNQDLYISDASNTGAAILVYRAATSTAFVPGQEVTVFGTKAIYNAAPQIAAGAKVEVLSSDNVFTVTPIVVNNVTEFGLTAESLAEKYTNQLVTVTIAKEQINPAFSISATQTTSTSSTIVLVVDGTNMVIKVRVDALMDITSIAEKLADFCTNKDRSITITGRIAYDKGVRIVPRSGADIVFEATPAI